MRGLPALVADLSGGEWDPQTEVLFDICVMDIDAQSYTSCTVDSVLLSTEKRNTWRLLGLGMHLSPLLSP